MESRRLRRSHIILFDAPLSDSGAASPLCGESAGKWSETGAFFNFSGAGCDSRGPLSRPRLGLRWANAAAGMQPPPFPRRLAISYSSHQTSPDVMGRSGARLEISEGRRVFVSVKYRPADRSIYIWVTGLNERLLTLILIRSGLRLHCGPPGSLISDRS